LFMTGRSGLVTDGRDPATACIRMRRPPAGTRQNWAISLDSDSATARAETPVQGTKPTRVLVTTGIHDWSRNPIYLGMFLVYGGIGIAVRSPWILILALPLAIVMCYGVVAGGGVPGRPLR